MSLIHLTNCYCTLNPKASATDIYVYFLLLPFQEKKKQQELVEVFTLYDGVSDPKSSHKYFKAAQLEVVLICFFF